ncbi:MAG: phage antirepressor [Propionicimonas sp.]
MDAQIIPFTYAEAQELRTVVLDGDPWFVASDVATILGLGNPRPSLALLDDDERGVHTVDTLGGPQSLTIVSEPGLYSLILRSRRPEAKAFKRWLTHDVIPAIRKTGGFGLAHQLPQNYAEALRELASTVEAHELAKVRIRELTPAASAWASLVEATGDYAVGDAAKMLSRDPSIAIGQNTLFRWLGKHGWLYRRADEWHPYQDKIDSGLLTLKTNRPYWDSRRGVDVLPAPTVRVTAKGVQKLYVLLGGAEALEVAS